MKYGRKTRRGSKKSVSKQARAVVKASKSLMLKSVETKYITFDGSTVTKSEGIFSYSPTQQLTVGNTANTRVGDSVLLQSLILSGEWVCLANIMNVKYRLIVGWTRNQSAQTTVAKNTLTSSDLFYVQSGFLAHRIINPSIFTVLYDEMVDINSNTTTGSDVKSFYSVINLGLKKFEYAAVGGSLGKTRNLVVVFIPMLTAGQPSDTTTGSIQLNSVLKFKDP